MILLVPGPGGYDALDAQADLLTILNRNQIKVVNNES